ncbi:aspartate/glutamate racemase family protein [Thermomicrobiaceae bacterium CFH 74404]|uniref:Aspartate/glutamate racemase family protein n=2 Tax=Thermalbibacter longus TaxID=2951981 RepID=A0AA41WIF8_9BACT|nr:aspartate/glutamate racemase family protein [Thermalbibacter longus]
MLDTRFPRIPGDIGNASTWPFPVAYRVVSGATPDLVVRHLSETDLVQKFIDAARDLEGQGVELITTGCGFLILYQEQLQESVGVPVLTSSLLQIPLVATLLPRGRSIGVLTVERRSLTPQHLAAARVPQDTPITVVGLEEAGGHFTSVLLDNLEELDVERATREHEDAARLLLERDPCVGAIVLECTNMPPYAHRIRALTGLPVFDVTTMIRWAVASHDLGSFHDSNWR